MAVELRKPEDFDIPQVLQIFARNDPDRILLFNRGYYEWQFHHIPGKARSLVAVEKNKVIAFGALLPFKASVKGECCIVFEGAEFVVAPEFCGRGIFWQLAYTLYEQIENENHTFAFASHLSFRSYQQKLGHRFIGYFPYWIGFPDFEALVHKKIGQLSFLMEPFYKSIGMKSLKLDNGMVIEGLEGFNKNWDVVETWKYQSDFYLIKNADYLNWRYIYIPSHKYDIYGAFREEKPVGYIVLRSQNLIDIGYSDNGVLEQLLNFASIYFKENKVLMAHAYLNLDTDGRIILRKKGFIKSNIFQNKFTTRFVYPPQRTVVKAKSYDETFPRLDSWTFTMGDLDCKL